MSLAEGRLKFEDDGAGTVSVDVVRRSSYPVSVGRGRFEDLPRSVEASGAGDSVVVVTDSNVAELVLDRALTLLAAHGFRTESIVVPAGEASKSWPASRMVIDALSAHRTRRRTVLVALGGGVVIDMVGFVASVYMRGLPYVNVPTSLMAQLDAAIGGKTGIDYAGSKNMLGSFHHPSAVLVDPDLLATLPHREIRSGLAEAVKVGMLHEPLFRRLEELDGAGRSTDPALLEPVVRDAVMVKMALLSDDPFERSLIRLLNLGHAVGHALEAATGFWVYRHGEAVAIGIAVASVISRDRGICTPETADRVLACLSACGLETSFPPALADATWEEIDVVRRIRNGDMNEVLPVVIGECVVVADVARAEFDAAVSALAGPSRDAPEDAAVGSR